jgi:hypothetical protein
MNRKKTESKYTSPLKHIIINDTGIGSNRIVQNNNYLNSYNYFNKNNIKMLELHKKQYLINKLKLERFKTEDLIPGLPYTSLYYKYNNNAAKINNKKKSGINNTFKKAEINYSNGSFELKTNTIKINVKTTTRGNIYDDLIKNLNKKKHSKNGKQMNNYNCWKKSYSINSFNHVTNKNNDNEFYNSDYKKKRKFVDDIKCRIIFGKNLASDYKKRLLFYQNEKNKSRDYFLNKLNKSSNNQVFNNISKTKCFCSISEINKKYDKDINNFDLNNISTIYKKPKKGKVENNYDENNYENNYQNNENEQKPLNEDEDYYKFNLLPLIK